MNKITEQIYHIGIVPVVVLNNAENAVPLAKALKNGGIPTAEVTFRTPAAKESIRRITENVPGIIVGAGTVTSVEMAKQALEAGAKYIVSPGFNPKVVKFCLEQNVPVLPGVSSPTEIEAAMDLGLTVLKFFPAEQNGGCKMLKALASPYQNIKFIPTGGVGLKNLNEYLNLPNVLACGGSWICPASMVDAQKFEEIEALCRQAVLSMHDFSLLHIGLNSADAKEAKENADSFAGMFSLPITETPGAYFAGTMMEIVKSPSLGTHGHIAISTNNVDRAIAYFEEKGYAFRPETVLKDEKGTVLAYFEKEIGGFAVHLRRKPVL